MKFGPVVWLSHLFLCLSSVVLWAGGSGLNVVVIVNGTSTNSLQVGNYYCERRQVPPSNLLRIYWTNSGPATSWATSDFTNTLLGPLGAMLATRQLTNQIHYLVLSMDIPYRLDDSTGTNQDSTTSALFYGFKTNDASAGPGNPAGCALPPGSSNSYSGSEMIFRLSQPGNLSLTNLLTTMLTSSGDFTLSDAVVDQGVNSDSTFPTQTVYLSKTPDLLRNVRYPAFNNAIFNTRLRGFFPMQQTNTDQIWNLGPVLGLQTGLDYSAVGPPTTYVPGSMADNLTSYGGAIFATGGQLPITQFLAFGAAGAYGTVTEPCNSANKFPSPQIFFYQARGFSLAECYYMGVTNPYQGMLMGEPLAKPFAAPGFGMWNSLPLYSVLSGTTNLSYQFTASDAHHPLSQADLFVDGLWFQTLTNIPPGTNNSLTVTINGFQTNYTVPGGATLASIATALTARLNASSYSNLTKVSAYAHGDRIELKSTDRSKLGSQVLLLVGSSIGTGTTLTTYLSSSGAAFLDSVAPGVRGFTVTGSPTVGSFIYVVVTNANNATVTIGATNSTVGASLATLAQSFVNAVNGTAALQGPDGINAQDLANVNGSPTEVGFNLYANSGGWNASQVQAAVHGSSGLFPSPSGSVTLDSNVGDLEPRAHVYVSAGVTNLSATFPLNTSSLPDGYHDLAVVAYEGSHVRTQARSTQSVRVQNNPLSATLTTLSGASNTIIGTPLQFSVTANTNNIAKIELFGTGGSLGSVSGQSNAIFTVSGSLLGLGLHPFYAVVTANSGKQYRTATTWIRLVTVPPFVEPAFSVKITAPPPELSWPATAGRSYDILSTTDITNNFQFRTSVVPSNSPALWTETNAASRSFYKVRTSN